MPKVPVDYSQTCIYKLVHFDDLNDENIYVGHTTNMVKRRHKHKQSSCNPNNKEYNQKKYQYIRDNGGWDNWRMILIEKYPCKDSHEAIARERYWVKELKATLNSNEPGRTKKEWREDNRDIILEKNKQYNEANRDKILEKHKQYYYDNREKFAEKNKEYYKEWYENNKEKVAEYNKEYKENNKEQIAKYQKEYYENNKEKVTKRIKKYRENNKEQINEKNAQKITCECNCVVRKGNISKHIKTIKHQEWLKNNNLSTN